jgi:hypothetical protein
MDTKRKGTMLRLTEQDLQAVLKIRQYYGITSDNQAIVFAVNVVARQIEEGRASVPNKEQSPYGH